MRSRIAGQIEQIMDKYPYEPKLTIQCDRRDLLEIIDALDGFPKPEAAPTWRLVHSENLPRGSPVDPGSTLYAFYSAPEGAHWEYDLPDVPGTTK
jgi:hypothetical protein